MSDLVLIERGGGARHEASDGDVIGRDAACAVVIDDEEISRRHARLLAKGEGLAIEDLGSANGTFVNGDRISSPTELRGGDSVAVGGVTLTVETAAARTRLHGSVPAAGQTRMRPSVSPPEGPPGTGASPFQPPEAGAGPAARRTRRSAATRSGATIASYATILATAAGVVAYLAER